MNSRPQTLILVLAFFVFFSCQKEEVITFDCLPEQDLGFASFTPANKTLFLYDYGLHQQLIFTNSLGDSLGFYAKPIDFGLTSDFDAYHDTLLVTDNRRCSDDVLTQYTFNQEHYAAIYVASWSNRSVGLGVNFFPRLKQGLEFNPAYPDDYDYIAVFHSQYDESQMEFSIEISEEYEKDILVDETFEWEVFYQDFRLNNTDFEDVFVFKKKTGDFTLVYSLQEGFLGFVFQEAEWTFSHYSDFPEDLAYNFTLPDPAGEEVQFFDVPGELYLIDFWASWCEPCIHEIESTLKPLHEEYADLGLTIISVSIDLDHEAWQAGLEELQMPWLQLISAEGFASPLLLNYEVYGIPTIYVVDEQKNIVSNNLRGEELEQFVEGYFN